jgi:hypothetical protein
MHAPLRYRCASTFAGARFLPLSACTIVRIPWRGSIPLLHYWSVGLNRKTLISDKQVFMWLVQRSISLRCIHGSQAPKNTEGIPSRKKLLKIRIWVVLYYGIFQVPQHHMTIVYTYGVWSWWILHLNNVSCIFHSSVIINHLRGNKFSDLVEVYTPTPPCHQTFGIQFCF